MANPKRTPRLELFPERIAANARAVVGLCHRHGVQVAGVAKGAAAHPAVLRALAAGGADMLADSRVPNLRAAARIGLEHPRLLLALPTPSRARDVVRWADVSLNSSLETLRLLSRAAASRGVRHQVVIMVDLGDLREGVWPDRAVALVRGAAALPGLQVLGLGSNLACFGGVIPATGNMEALVALRDTCREATGLGLDLLSGGNSANLPLLLAGGMPSAINHLRIGETILLGRNVLDRSPWPGTRQDTFRLVAEVVEVERKPSAPIGARGQDAFGQHPVFVDRGRRLRAICNLGRQDVRVDGITAELPGIVVLGGSSDHLILDVEDCGEPVAVGTELAFAPGYGALLALSTSPYVSKAVMP